MTKYRILGLLLLFLSITVRVFHLGNQSYWVDEMISLHFVSQPQWRALFYDNHPLLYHVILKFWVILFGFGEAATRSLSVIFSVCSTAMIGFLALKIFKSKKMSLLAMFFHAVSAFSLIYAQETRMYSLFEFAAIVNLFLFYKLIFENGSLGSFVFSCIFLMLSHYAGIYLIVYEVMVIGYRRFGKKSSVPVIFLFWILAVGFLYFKSLRLGALDWQSLKFEAEPESRWPLELLLHLSHLSYWALIWYPFFILASFFEIKKDAFKMDLFLLFIGFFIFSLGATEIAVLLFKRALFIPRYFIFLNPVFILILCLCLSVLRKRLFVITVITFSLIMVAWLPKAYFVVKSPWNKLAQTMGRERGTMVYTTRTTSISTPYFDQIGIPVINFLPSDASLAQMIEKVQQGEKVWVVENYWGHVEYWDMLKKKLFSLGVPYQEQEFQEGLSEPLSVIKLAH